MKRGEYSWTAVFIIAILSFLIYFFINNTYHSKFAGIFMALVFGVTSALAYRKSTSALTLVLITSISVFLSFGISFNKMYAGSSPITLHFILGPWIIFLISFLITLLVWYWYEKSSYKYKYPLILLILYIFIWVILSINVAYFDDWKMENYLTVPFVLLIFLSFKKFKLSNISYSLIFIYMTLHIIGTHYTYSEVPFGFWLQNFFSLPRNHYDRIVHFSFGLLLAYPIREVAIRIGNLKGIWNLYFPIDFVLAFSAIYEIIEMAIAIMFGGDLGIAYLGTQGDIWDAQKDMLMAGLGSVVAMIFTGIVIWYYNSKRFVRDIRESLKIKSKKVLGEKEILRFIKKK